MVDVQMNRAMTSFFTMTIAMVIHIFSGSWASQYLDVMYAIPSNFAILSVGFLLIELNKGVMYNVYYLRKIIDFRREITEKGLK